MEEIGALTAAIREEGLNVPVAYGESARRFHTIKAYIDAVLRDGKLFLPDCPGLPVRADLERLEADGLLNEKQTLLPKTI